MGRQWGNNGHGEPTPSSAASSVADDPPRESEHETARPQAAPKEDPLARKEPGKISATARSGDDGDFDAKVWLRSELNDDTMTTGKCRAKAGSGQQQGSCAGGPGAYPVEGGGSTLTVTEDATSTNEDTAERPLHFYAEPSASVVARLVTDDDDAEKLRERLQEIENAPTATVVDNSDSIVDDNSQLERSDLKRKGRLTLVILLALLLIAVIVATVLGVLVATGAFQEAGKEPMQSTTSTAAPIVEAPPIQPQKPTLQKIQERGFIRCRVINRKYDKGGISYVLCHALSAAIFDGDPNRTKFYDNMQMPLADMWRSLDNGTLDIGTSWNTNHIGRDVYESHSTKPKSFSTPYFITGTLVAGHKDFVQCVDNQDTITGVCKDLMICVPQHSSTSGVIQGHMEGSNILEVSIDDFFTNLASGVCNVIAGEPQYMSEEKAREAGYTGDYTLGSSLLSTEPQAMSTSEEDPQWTDFSTSVLQALFTAELEHITPENATLFPETTLFGDQYKHMFQHAVASMGHWGTVFEQTFGLSIERSAINEVNRDHWGGGLLYAPPLADLDYSPKPNETPPGPRVNGTLEAIAKRGYLRCGIIPDRPGFAQLRMNNKSATEEREDWTGMDVEFCHCLAVALFGDPALVEFVSLEDQTAGFSALAEALVDVAAGFAYTLQADIKEPSTNQGYTFSPSYFYEEGIDGDRLALVTTQNATQWSDFVRWTVYGVINAEEQGIHKEDASKMPSVDLFGPDYTLMFRLIVLNCGNYADMYEKNLQHLIPRSGPNLLNNGATPLIHPLPLQQFQGQLEP